MNIATLADTAKEKASQIVQSGIVFDCIECGNPIVPVLCSNVFGDLAYLVKDIGMEFWKLDAPEHQACIEKQKIKTAKMEQERLEKETREQQQKAMKEFIASIPHEAASYAELENFITEEESAEAHALACAWNYDDFGIMFSGPSGTGKSHLMVGLAKKIFRSGADVVFVQTSTIYEEAGKNNFQVPHRYIHAGFLFLDDLGTENLNEMKREWIFNLLEGRKNKSKITFISTNLSVKDLREKFFERIASRIFELTVPVIVSGKDHRLEKLKDRMAEFKSRIKK